MQNTAYLNDLLRGREVALGIPHPSCDPIKLDEENAHA